MNCKYCNSENVSKFGTVEGVQRYWCKDCCRKFADNGALPKMKTDKDVIAEALSCYFGGMPLDAIQTHLNQQHGVYYTEAGIYNWVTRFGKDAANIARDYHPPKLGDEWIVDETAINVGNRKVWFWDVIDTRSRYLLASRISESRTIKDAQTLMEKAAKVAGKPPKVILSDGLPAYIDGIELTFGSETEHIRSRPMTSENSTSMIERFHETLKQRLHVMKDFKDPITAQDMLDAWLVQYNFFKEHESLGNVPPAQAMGKTPMKDWRDVIDHVEVKLIRNPEPNRVTWYRPPSKPKTITPKRRRIVTELKTKPAPKAAMIATRIRRTK
jgi:putative transposase